ncbi:MAG: type II toxin-antitoxin system RelE/ParE family toxin [Synergistaceae bacterium]|nr:type II toxin-antitoxin system RelE/ParE family toxin [Synergistaceae bacterium]
MTVIFSTLARKIFLKLDKPTQEQIQTFVLKLQDAQNPRLTGKALVGDFTGLWCYQVGDHKLICVIEDNKIFVTMLHIGHRKDADN